jgi:hypothetical protein
MTALPIIASRPKDSPAATSGRFGGDIPFRPQKNPTTDKQ